MATIFQITRRALALIILCLASLTVHAQNLYTGSGVLSEEVERTYVKGMQYLVRTQTPAGNWPDTQVSTSPAITALAVVSMLAHGDDPNFGPYSGAIHHGLDYILKQMDPKTGYIGPSMYNHGFSTLALAECYGAVEDARLGPALQRAVQLILSSQEQNGAHAWRYSPDAKDADCTVSGAQMVALLAARNAGIAVPEKNIQDGVNFYLSLQTADGGIGYTSPVGANDTHTAIFCLVLALAKDKDSPAFKAGFRYLLEHQPDNQYPEYFRYYASQAYFRASPELWQNWNRDNIKMLRATQAADGNWDGSIGPTFSTSASLLSLALNYRYLPIYER